MIHFGKYSCWVQQKENCSIRQTSFTLNNSNQFHHRNTLGKRALHARLGMRVVGAMTAMAEGLASGNRPQNCVLQCVHFHHWRCSKRKHVNSTTVSFFSGARQTFKRLHIRSGPVHTQQTLLFASGRRICRDRPLFLQQMVTRSSKKWHPRSAKPRENYLDVLALHKIFQALQISLQEKRNTTKIRTEVRRKKMHKTFHPV